MVDVTELDGIVDKALFGLHEVEDGEVDETTGLELLDRDVEDVPEIDKLSRLELDEAAFRLFEGDKPALLYVSMPVTYTACPEYTYMLVVTEMLEAAILGVVVCDESDVDIDWRLDELSEEEEEGLGVPEGAELLDALACGPEEVASVM